MAITVGLPQSGYRLLATSFKEKKSMVTPSPFISVYTSAALKKWKRTKLRSVR